MSLENFVTQYGYVALFIGTFVEGETVLILAGYLVHLGYLTLPGVMLAAFLGSLTGDQLFYFIGYYSGSAFLEKRPHWKKRADRVHDLLSRHRIKVILGFRFLYGFRLITPLVIGWSGIRPPLFIGLNILGALIWSMVVASAGFYFGEALESLISDARKFERWVILGLLVAGGLIWLVRLGLRRRAGKGPKDDPA